MVRAEGRNAGFCGRKRAVASVAPIPALDVRRDSIPRRACLPYLMGKAPQLSTLSAMSPKSGAPTLKRFCPAGQTASIMHTGSAPYPQGKAASFPLGPMIPSCKSGNGNAAAVLLHVLALKKMGKTAQRGKNKAEGAAFSTLARRFLAPQEQGATRARRPSRQCRLPTPSAPCRRAHAPRARGPWALRFVSAGVTAGVDGGRAHEQGPAAVCEVMR